MKTIYILLIALICCSLFVSCNESLITDAKKIEVGMTISEVKELLGENGTFDDWTVVYKWNLSYGQILEVRFDTENLRKYYKEHKESERKQSEILRIVDNSKVYFALITDRNGDFISYICGEELRDG